MERGRVELPQDVIEKLGTPPVNGQLFEATRYIFEIWYGYFQGSQTREASKQRKAAMGEYLESLSSDIQGELESHLPLIRDEAFRVSQEEQQRQQSFVKGSSHHGASVARRRQLAHKRRGIDPKLIH